MKKSVTVALILALVGAIFLVGGASATLKTTSSIAACEACGMQVEKTDLSTFKIVDADGGEHWACCPICGEVVGMHYQNSEINAKCFVTGQPIRMTVANGNCTSVFPSGQVTIVLGGSCATNKITSSPENARTVRENYEWASNASLKTVPQSFAAAGKKLAQMTVGYKAVSIPQMNYVLMAVGAAFLVAAPVAWKLVQRRAK